MSKSHNNEAILKILEEDSSLRDDFYSILDSIMKDLANFNYPLASNFRKYFNFKRMLEDIANLPKNNRESEFKNQNASPPLSLEDREIAYLIGLLPLKLSTFEKKVEKEIKLLKGLDSNFILMMFLDHIFYLLKNPEFRDLALTRKTPVIIDPEIKNLE